MDAELFYQLLLGELDAGGTEPAAGYSLILDAARKTNDPALYQRAVDIAFQARSGDAALQAARAWKQAYPQSREANRYVLQILFALNRVVESVEPLKAEVALADPKDRNAVLAVIPRSYSRVSDKKLAADVVETGPGRVPGPAGDRRRGLDCGRTHAAGRWRQGRRPGGRPPRPGRRAPPAKDRPCWRWN